MFTLQYETRRNGKGECFIRPGYRLHTIKGFNNPRKGFQLQYLTRVLQFRIALVVKCDYNPVQFRTEFIRLMFCKIISRIGRLTPPIIRLLIAVLLRKFQ